MFVLDYGTLTLNADGTYSYVIDDSNPLVDALNVGDSLDDAFTYEVTDLAGETDSATLTITINGSNDAPVARPDGPAAVSTQSAGRLEPSWSRRPAGGCA